MVDHYHYWIGSNRHLLIVVTTVIGNTMATEQKTDCDIDNCPGASEEPTGVCVICGASVHPTCFKSTVRKLQKCPSSCHDEVFCSSTCCTWYDKEGLDKEAVKKEREALNSLLKKQLVQLAATAQVRVTHRIDNKSRQMSKPMMIRRLLGAKFGVVKQLSASSKPAAKTTHDKFHLLNCLFSDEIGALAATAEGVSRADLDTGAVGGNSSYWKVVEKRFNEGFPDNSVDGPVFADKVHFMHPSIQEYHETASPAIHGTFTSEELRKMWKEIQKDYDQVMMNYTKSGNHNSNFTKAAMMVLREQGVLDTTEEDFDEADEDDAFGVEEGRFCNFTNSILIIYLRMWLNERPGLVNFVSRQILGPMQLDSMATAVAAAPASSKKSEDKRRSPDLLANAIKELAESRK